MTELSPAASAIWEAFNQDEAGIFVDYGDKLAAALRAAADQVVPQCNQPSYADDFTHRAWFARDDVRDDLLRIANELETQ